MKVSVVTQPMKLPDLKMPTGKRACKILDTERSYVALRGCTTVEQVKSRLQQVMDEAFTRVMTDPRNEEHPTSREVIISVTELKQQFGETTGKPSSQNARPVASQ